MNGDVLRLEGDCTIYRAAELKPLMLGSLRAAGTVTFDLSEVTEIDSAGVQLLLLARREAAGMGGSLRLAEPSPAVCEVLDLLDLRAHFAFDAAAAAA